MALADPLQQRISPTVRHRGHTSRWQRLLTFAALVVLGLLSAQPAYALAAPEPLTPQPARPPQTYFPEPGVTPLAPGPVGTTVAEAPLPPLRQSQEPTTEFRASYTSAVPEAAKPPITSALNRWAAALRITIPVDVSIDWAPLASGNPDSTVAGLAGPTALVADFSGAPRAGIFYPAALANQLTGLDQVPDATDITIVLADRPDWDYATSGTVDLAKISLATVVLHELVHGLGFINALEVDESGVGSYGSPDGLPSVFDTFVVTSSGSSVVDLPANSTALGSALTQGLAWNGPSGIAADGGSRPVLFSPSPFQPESSVAHLDEATYPPADPDSLSTPTLTGNEAIYSVGTIAPAMLEDMGWTLEGDPTPPTPAPDPNAVPALAPVPARLPVSQPLPDPANIPAPTPGGTGGNPSVAPDPSTVPTAAAPPAGTTGPTGAQTGDGTLPRTGFPTGPAVLGGALAIAGGGAMVRRSQWTRPVSRTASLSS